MYKVFDEETQTHAKAKRKASPWHENNYIVARGWKNQGDACNSWKYFPEPHREPMEIEPEITLLVGFNLKFDLLWEKSLDNPWLIEFFKRGGAIWDCQYAEYLLRGQTPDALYISLDETVEKYGGTKKIDIIKELWEQGVQTSEIHEDLLIDYLVGTEAEGRTGGDIGNTEKVFLGQIRKAIDLGMLRAIQLRMDGLCATTDMEFNGLKIDIAEASRRAQVLSQSLAETEAELQSFIPELPEGLEFNWNSPIHKSSLIFGGTIKYKKSAPYMVEKPHPTQEGEVIQDWARLRAFEDCPVFNGNPVDRHSPHVVFDTDSQQFIIPSIPLAQDRFKSGKRKGELRFAKVEVEGPLKTKKQDFFFELPGFTPPNSDWAGALEDGAGNPVYSVGEDTLKELAKRDVPFVKALTKQAALAKELGTYYISVYKDGELKGMLTCVDPGLHVIHHKLNHVNTVTTRLSSSDPNLQNLPRKDKSEVKKMFVSRFGDEGEMLEADYSQLEVVVQGLLSLDPNLCKDLRDKIDFHCKRVSAKHAISYEEALARCKDEDHPEYGFWKAERTKCKIFSFQRAYGAGAATIAEETGLTVEEVKAMMEAEDIMYPKVVEFNEAVEAAANKSAVPFRDPERGWRPFRRGFYQAPTGCLYSFRTWDAPKFLKERGINDSFSPPELKNYPVQGTGGEIVQIILGLLWRRFVETDNYGGCALFCNTVHDCIWVDMKKIVRNQVAADVKRIMESVPEVLMENFGMECPVPFPVEVETGPNMYDLKHFQETH